MAENKNYAYKKQTVYEKAGAEVVAAAYEYAKDYVKYLDAAKTEAARYLAALNRREQTLEYPQA